MKIYTTLHRGEVRLIISYSYNTAITNCIRLIAQARWSRSLQAWHIPYSYQSLQAFEQKVVPTIHEEQCKLVIPEITIAVHLNSVYIHGITASEDITYIQTINFARFIPYKNCWFVPHYKNNLQQLELHFGIRTQAYSSQQIIKKPMVRKRIPKVISDATQEHLDAFKKWLEYKRYSVASIRTYIDTTGRFLEF